MKPSVKKATGADVVLVEGGLGPDEQKRLARYAACTQLSLRQVVVENLECLDHLPALESIQLYATRIADWSALTRVKKLQSLFVNGIKDPEQLAIVARLPRLRSLRLANLPTLTSLPDLASCRQLRDVLLWNCKRLRDISALLRAPRLEELSLVSTPHAPADLEPLLALPRLAYVAATFGTNRANAEFAALLARYGKRAHRPEGKPAGQRRRQRSA